MSRAVEYRCDECGRVLLVPDAVLPDGWVEVSWRVPVRGIAGARHFCSQACAVHHATNQGDYVTREVSKR